MMSNLRAHEPPSQRASNARRNPEDRTIENTIARLRRPRKQPQGPAREALINELMAMERQQRTTPGYAKDKKHPSTGGYARSADDFVMMVQGQQGAAQAIKDAVGKKLQEMRLALSAETTKLTHGSYHVNCLGYQRHAKPTRQGTRSRPSLRGYPSRLV
jgi:hypothetical protein